MVFPTNGEFRMLGSYNNPSGLAATLAFSFPIMLMFYNKYKPLIAYGALVFLVTIVLSGSRAGLLAFLIPYGIFFVNNLSLNLKQYKKSIIVGIVFLSISFFVCLLFWKKDSAIGRTLIWQVAGGMVLEIFFFGEGSYGFYKSYMKHQAQYFINTPKSNYTLLASNIMHPFNEYLLFLSKYGLFAFCIVIYCFVILVKNTRWSNPYLLCLISIAVFSLFSYPFQYPITWVVLIYSIVRLSKNTKTLFYVSRKVLSFFILPLLVLSWYLLIKDIKFEYEWRRIAMKSHAGRTEEVLPQYEKLYKDWNGNHLFLYNYAAELNHVGESKRSNEVLVRTLEYWNDYDIQMLLGDNFKALHRWTDAERHFKLASKMVPNRFLPLYNLHEVYVNSNRKDEAKQIANEILSKQVKIPSATVYSIQAEMKKYIKENIK